MSTLTVGEVVKQHRGEQAPAAYGANLDTSVEELARLEACTLLWPEDISDYDTLRRAIAKDTGLRALQVSRVLGPVLIARRPPSNTGPILITGCRRGTP